MFSGERTQQTNSDCCHAMLSLSTNRNGALQMCVY
jgi:hypothetical protein